MQTLKIGFQENTHVGLKRKANEDSHGHKNIPGCGHVFVVCDGMGGHVGGKVASQTAVECILEYFKTHIGGNPNVNIHEALKFANTQVFAKALNDPTLKGMGTTCVVAIVQEDGRIYYGHVGDSRIYLQTNGKLIRITKDHSFVQYLVDSNQISEEEAEQHPNKNQILKALGIDENVEPEIPSEPICPSAGDILMLCSDGLCGMTTDKKMEKVLNEKNDGTYSDKLIQLALDGGGADNVTAIVVKVEESPFNKTTYALPKQLYNAPQATSNDTGNKKTSGIKQLLENSKIKALLVVIVLLLAGIVYMSIGGKGGKKHKDKNQVSGTTDNDDVQAEDDGGWFGSINIFSGNSSKDEEKVVNVNSEKKEDKKEDKSKNLKSDTVKVPETIAPSNNEPVEQDKNKPSENRTDNSPKGENLEKNETNLKTEAQANPVTPNQNNNPTIIKEITLDKKFKPKCAQNSDKIWDEVLVYIKEVNKPKLDKLTVKELRDLNPDVENHQVKNKQRLKVSK